MQALEAKDMLRFMRKCMLAAGGCWEWQGARDQSGYGWFRLKSRAELAHRVAYEIWVGAHDSRSHVHHTCGNPRCVNPDHLLEMLAGDHARSHAGPGINKGAANRRKTHCPKGHPYDEANTGIWGGKRYCRECRRGYSRRYAERKRASALDF